MSESVRTAGIHGDKLNPQSWARLDPEQRTNVPLERDAEAITLVQAGRNRSL